MNILYHKCVSAFIAKFCFCFYAQFYSDLKLFIACFVQVSYSLANGTLITTTTNASTITVSNLNSNTQYCFWITIEVTRNNMVSCRERIKMIVTTGKIEKFGLCFVCILFTLQLCLSCNA